jgi:hypothetical protein
LFLKSSEEGLGIPYEENHCARMQPPGVTEMRKSSSGDLNLLDKGTRLP